MDTCFFNHISNQVILKGFFVHFMSEIKKQ